MPERHSWNTPFPDLSEVKGAVDRLADDASLRLDVHTATVRLNNGGWDLILEATDEDLADWTLMGTVSQYGAVVDLTEVGA
jgi:hypothetical protein